ncbi:MAG TPA: alpha-galactosidase [Candidatus Phocaeicola excrementigallinarum]|nr:alpha-galactosidase [Candidatus Phocaeicola excrementigallinarum]
MKKELYLLAGLTLSATALPAENVCISTPKTSMVINATQGQELKFVYYGEKLSAGDLSNLDHSGLPQFSAYPVYGLNCPGEAALAVRHSDGNMSLQMEVEKTETRTEGNATITTVSMKDKVYPFYIDVCYKAWQDADIIETWTEIRHTEKKAVTLNQFASAYLPIRRGNVWLSSLYGSWANEGQLAQEPLKPGMKVIKNKDGVRNSHTAHAEVMFSLDGHPQENTGDVIGAALCYTGNYKLRIDTDDSEYHQFYAGINEENSSYTLEKEEVFHTPELALTYSGEGLSGASRNFHRWARQHKLAHGNQPRRILLNSWEGVYFDINQEGMDQMMADIASMGGELFVMDDGWFGDKYKRNTDNSSLGDWVVDTTKLPEGIDGLLADAEKHGVKFGIWIEPEMANTTSELYEKHPEWILKAPQRDPVLGRGGTQVVLDLGNPEVQDFVFGVVDDLMTKHPKIDYIKWDANMAVMNHGSNYLDKEKQSHMYIEYHRGFEKVCQRIRAKYPDLTIQACASGGGRANYGYLPYFDEFWVSDNTDALQRIYMQWGTSYFFPAIAMASHISAAPNHQTFRTIPLKYRIDVAMSGRLGMEIQPKNMTDEEKELCRKAIADYKTIRPVVQFGDIYRLVSPYDRLGVASLMYTSPEKDKAVFYWWKTETFVNQHLPRVKMAGLSADKMYRVHELNRIDNKPLEFEGKTFSGSFLMNNGLEIPYTHNVDYHKLNDYASRVLYLEEVE